MGTLLLRSAAAAVGGFVGGPMGAGIATSLLRAIPHARSAHRAGAQDAEGPRLTTLAGLTSTEGAPIPRLYGRVRVGGEVIWCTRFEESVTVTRSGGSGGKSLGPTLRRTDYSYFANLAVGLCEGPVTEVRRIWADGRELDQTLCTLRVHTGSETQEPDPLILAKEGAGQAPAYRGLAYVVFERLPLEGFGNRIPQLAFEVVRAIAPVAGLIRGVNIIPGAGEYAYAPQSVLSTPDLGVTAVQNRHQLVAASDWTASLDALGALCPRLESASLVVTWFGDDLRASRCSVAPRVEAARKPVPAMPWSVAGLTRETARVVSQHEGAPAFGGTPCDASLRAALADLAARGLAVTFYPFLMMDIPAGNGMDQPAYPWRGRITCTPGADGTAQARAEVNAFFAQYRPMLLHYAALCAEAGGVEAFLLGSELRGLTQLRDETDDYPAARALCALARELRTILPPQVKLGYAADWTEYGANARNGGADVDFPLDALWACEAIDFIGIDAYFPLSDWRDGTAHLDAQEAAGVHERAYLARRVTAGEGFDWFYADAQAREAQQRTPITDGAYGKPWMFRPKDLKGWWSSPHVERRNGLERARPTAFVPLAKPIRLVEIGCPALDRGANAPNVFADAKSAEAALPPFSRGFRDDLMQARALEAMLVHYGEDDARNPRSPLTGRRMVEPGRIHVWAWDARPFPAFPGLAGVWADAANWETGHWLNGRLEGAPLDALVGRICDDLVPGHAPLDTEGLEGHLDGYAIDRVLPARAALAPLALLFGFEAALANAALRFVGPAAGPVTRLGAEDLVPGETGALLQGVHGAEADLPQELALAFADGDLDYRPANVTAHRLAGGPRRKLAMAGAMVLPRALAQRQAEVALADLWSARDAVEMVLRPDLVALEPGDCVALDLEGVPRLLRILRIAEEDGRRVTARAVVPALQDTAPRLLPRPALAPPTLAGPPHVEVLDLAIARDDTQALQHLAVFADPWPGPLALWKRAGDSDFTFERLVARPAVLGVTLDDFGAGTTDLFDRRNGLRLRLFGGALSSVEDVQLFAGRNVAALRGADGAWEIFGFARAELVAPQTWRLSRLLRGLGGEPDLAARSVPAGARFVLLDEAVVPLASGLPSLGVAATWRIGPAARGFSDPAVTEFAATPTARALLPYAPLRLRATRAAEGVRFQFLRRGRRDADAWEGVDIPLGEEREAYVLSLWRNGAPLRRIAAASAPILYAAADELADFGAPQTAFDVTLQQVSATVGPGFALRTTIICS